MNRSELSKYYPSHHHWLNTHLEEARLLVKHKLHPAQLKRIAKAYPSNAERGLPKRWNMGRYKVNTLGGLLGINAANGFKNIRGFEQYVEYLKKLKTKANKTCFPRPGYDNSRKGKNLVIKSRLNNKVKNDPNYNTRYNFCWRLDDIVFNFLKELKDLQNKKKEFNFLQEWKDLQNKKKVLKPSSQSAGSQNTQRNTPKRPRESSPNTVLNPYSQSESSQNTENNMPKNPKRPRESSPNTVLNPPLSNSNNSNSNNNNTAHSSKRPKTNNRLTNSNMSPIPVPEKISKEDVLTFLYVLDSLHDIFEDTNPGKKKKPRVYHGFKENNTNPFQFAKNLLTDKEFTSVSQTYDKMYNIKKLKLNQKRYDPITTLPKSHLQELKRMVLNYILANLFRGETPTSTKNPLNAYESFAPVLLKGSGNAQVARGAFISSVLRSNEKFQNKYIIVNATKHAFRNNVIEGNPKSVKPANFTKFDTQHTVVTPAQIFDPSATSLKTPKTFIFKDQTHKNYGHVIELQQGSLTQLRTTFDYFLIIPLNLYKWSAKIGNSGYRKLNNVTSEHLKKMEFRCEARPHDSIVFLKTLHLTQDINNTIPNLTHISSTLAGISVYEVTKRATEYVQNNNIPSHSDIYKSIYLQALDWKRQGDLFQMTFCRDMSNALREHNMAFIMTSQDQLAIAMGLLHGVNVAYEEKGNYYIFYNVKDKIKFNRLNSNTSDLKPNTNFVPGVQQHYKAFGKTNKGKSILNVIDKKNINDSDKHFLRKFALDKWIKTQQFVDINKLMNPKFIANSNHRRKHNKNVLLNTATIHHLVNSYMSKIYMSNITRNQRDHLKKFLKKEKNQEFNAINNLPIDIELKKFLKWVVTENAMTTKNQFRNTTSINMLIKKYKNRYNKQKLLNEFENIRERFEKIPNEEINKLRNFNTNNKSKLQNTKNKSDNKSKLQKTKNTLRKLVSMSKRMGNVLVKNRK